MAKFGIGRSAARCEDGRFLSGHGHYIDDLTLPRQAHAYILRPPHARIPLRVWQAMRPTERG